MSNYQQAPQQRPTYEWPDEQLEQEKQRLRNATFLAGQAQRSYADVPQVNADMMKKVLDTRMEAANMSAVGVWLCIFCPSILIAMVSKADENVGLFSEDAASGLGVLFLFLMVGIAIYQFIMADHKKKQVNQQLRGFYRLSEDARAYLYAEKAAFEEKAPKMRAISVVMLILAVVPLIVAGAFGAPDYMIGIFVGWMLAIIATGVYGLVRIENKQSTFKKFIGK